MERLFDVEGYRNYLENFFVYKYDEKTFLERKKAIDKYTDDDLQKIINDTTMFIYHVIDKIEKYDNETIYFSINIDEMIYSISNGCVGGWPADTLYSLLDFDPNIRISRHLLKEFFPDFNIDRNDEIYEEYNEKEDVGSFYAVSKLTIIGTAKKLDKVNSNDNLKQEKQQTLVKVLKLIRDKKQN